MTYIYATIKPWNIDAFHAHDLKDSYDIHLITDPNDLSIENLERIRPKIIFFGHWSWIIKPEIFENYQCILFHPSELPKDRGGSPYQNQMIRGKKQTLMSAIEIVKDLDAGDIYLQKPLSLEGRMIDIFEKAAVLQLDMIRDILESNPQKQPQSGTVTLNKRRKPEESALPQSGTMDYLYDFIRMLDAPTYPKAFINHGDFIIEFDRVEKDKDGLSAIVKIRQKNDET